MRHQHDTASAGLRRPQQSHEKAGVPHRTVGGGAEQVTSEWAANGKEPLDDCGNGLHPSQAGTPDKGFVMRQCQFHDGAHTEDLGSCRPCPPHAAPGGDFEDQW